MNRLSQVIAAATLLQLVGVASFMRSDQLALAGDTLEAGILASKGEESDAVAKLSSGPHQQSWWKLAGGKPWHDSAFYRFFMDGPLKAAEMQNLAGMSGQKNAWRMSGITEVDSMHVEHNLMEVLQNLSTATYQMSTSIQGTGRIEASMWTLLFACENEYWCEQGYLEPMVTVPKNVTGAHLPPGTSVTYDNLTYAHATVRLNLAPGTSVTYDNLTYATVRLNLTSILSANANPCFIPMREKPTPYPIRIDDVSGLSVVANVYTSFPPCNPRQAAVTYRSLLDTAYGLVPGTACIRFSISNGEKWSVLVSSSLSRTATIKDAPSTLEDFLSLLLGTSNPDQWPEYLPFEECSKAMLMQLQSLGNFDGPFPMIRLCDPDSQVCIFNYADEVGSYSTCTGDVQHVRFLKFAVTHIQTNSCSLNDSSTNDYYSTTCRMGPKEVCTASMDFTSSEYYNTLPLFTPPSNWTTTEGLNTSEFNQAPHIADDLHRTCISEVSSGMFDADSSKQADDFHEAMRIQATSHLKSATIAHHNDFTIANGEAIALASFLPTILPTVFSALLTTLEFFPNLYLEFLCKLQPSLLDPQRGGSKLKVYSKLMAGSLVATVGSLLPLLYLAWNEKARENPFYTWDIGSADQITYIGSQALHLRVVYLVSVTSFYRSIFLPWTIGVVCATLLAVLGLSFWRSKQVLDRYSLLMLHNSLLHVGVCDKRQTPYVRALRAIHLTKADYEQIKEEVEQATNTVPHQNLELSLVIQEEPNNNVHDINASMGNPNSSNHVACETSQSVPILRKTSMRLERCPSKEYQ